MTNANSLVGKFVRFNHMKDGDARKVLGATNDGMVEVEGFVGQFAPHVFQVVERCRATMGALNCQKPVEHDGPHLFEEEFL